MSSSVSTSVIIPCYNGAAFLHETLTSVLNQTLSPLEIIVIDDGSTDRSASIARSFGPRVQVETQVNQGESVARNKGLDMARGDWIAFLDADDIWLPEKLEKQFAVVDDETVAVHTEVETFGTTAGISEFTKVPPDERYALDRFVIDNCLNTSSLLVRKTHSPRFPTWTQRGEDLIYMLDLIRKGPIQLVPEPLTRYRKHAGGQTSQITGEIEVHQAVLRWLADDPNPLSASLRQRIEATWRAHLANLAWCMKERRRWAEYWVFRQHLEAFSGDSKVDELLSNRIYPAFSYRVLDALPFRNR